MIGKKILAPMAAMLLVPCATSALAENEELIVRIQGFPSSPSFALQVGDRLDHQSGLNLHALDHAEFSKKGLDVELQWEPSDGDEDYWWRSLEKSLAPNLEAPTVVVLERGKPYPEIETDVVPVRIATLEERYELPVSSSLDWMLREISGHDEHTCKETPRQWDIVVYAKEQEVNDDPRIPKFLSALKTLVRQANTLKTHPFVANASAPKQVFGAYDNLLHSRIVQGWHWFTDETAHLIQPGWLSVHGQATIPDSYGIFGHNFGEWTWDSYMDGTVVAERLGERHPPCIRSWGFMTESSYEWSLSASETVVVQITWSAQFAVGGLHNSAPVEGFLYSAIVNGDFAARGLVVDIVSGAYGFDHYFVSGQYESLLYDVKWIGKAASEWGDNWAFLEQMRAMLEGYDEATAEVVRPDIVIGGDGFSAVFSEEQDIVVRSYRQATELVLEPHSCAYSCSPRYEHAIYASPKAEEDTRAERFLDAISDRIRSSWGVWLVDQGLRFHDATWTMYRDGQRIAAPDYPSALKW